MNPDLQEIAHSLGHGKEIKIGEGFLTLCPVHDDEKPSLSIKQDSSGGLIVNCHAGCDYRVVKDKMRDMGLLPDSRQDKQENLPGYVWDQSMPEQGKIKSYLATRNIHPEIVPGSLRWNNYKGKTMMVARVAKPGDGNQATAIQRTFIDRNYHKTDRKMLGPCKGRAVWFGQPQKKMIVGEGIETTLSAMVATGLPGVACLSVSGMKAVELPATVKELIILVDSDPNHAGQNASKGLATRFPGKVWFATPDDSCFTDEPRKLDFNDLDPGQIRERFECLTEHEQPEQEDRQPEIFLFDEEGKPKTKATVITEIGSQYELFHDETGEGYATITRDSHKETWPIRSKIFRELLSDRYFMLSNKGVSRNIVADAIDTLCGKARVQGKQCKVYRRVAELNGNIYVDLCDSYWRVVEVSKNSWQVLTDSPVKFLRSASSLSLPNPQKGGTLNDLWALINVRAEDRPLVIGFLSRALHPTPPYFGLCVVGEQGTGKSTFTTIIRSLCDPSTAMLRPPPKDDRDFLAGAVNNWCLTYDNLSGLQPWLSDSLCRVLTGGSFAARTLYSTVEETTIPLARPAILNGIDDLTSRPDLADRVIAIELQAIRESDRLEERSLWKRFDSINGKIFGTMLDGISSALKNIDNVKLSYRPRQIDATRWVTAAEKGLGLETGDFVKSYENNQREMVLISLESSPFVAAMIEMLKIQGKWEGAPTELLSILPNFARDEDTVKSKAWPKSPVWVGRILRRNAPALRKIGVGVVLSKNKVGRHIEIIMDGEPENLTPHSQCFDDEQECNGQGDGGQFSENTVFTVPTVSDQVKKDGKDGKDSKSEKVSDDGNASKDGKDGKDGKSSKVSEDEQEWEEF